MLCFCSKILNVSYYNRFFVHMKEMDHKEIDHKAGFLLFHSE